MTLKKYKGIFNTIQGAVRARYFLDIPLFYLGDSRPKIVGKNHVALGFDFCFNAYGMSNQVERKDIFDSLPNEIMKLCYLHQRETKHFRLEGTDTYVCAESHEGLIDLDVSRKIPRDPPPGTDQRLQR